MRRVAKAVETDGELDAQTHSEENGITRTARNEENGRGSVGMAEKVLSNAVVPPSGQRNAIIFVASVATPELERIPHRNGGLGDVTPKAYH